MLTKKNKWLRGVRLGESWVFKKKPKGFLQGARIPDNLRVAIEVMRGWVASVLEDLFFVLEARLLGVALPDSMVPWFSSLTISRFIGEGCVRSDKRSSRDSGKLKR